MGLCLSVFFIPGRCTERLPFLGRLEERIKESYQGNAYQGNASCCLRKISTCFFPFLDSHFSISDKVPVLPGHPDALSDVVRVGGGRGRPVRLLGLRGAGRGPAAAEAPPRQRHRHPRPQQGLRRHPRLTQGRRGRLSGFPSASALFQTIGWARDLKAAKVDGQI